MSERVIVKYSKDGRAVSDFIVDNDINVLINLIQTIKKIHPSENISSNFTSAYFHVSTDNIITAIREAIALDRIDCNDIGIEFDGNIYKINEFGSTPCWPDGLEDIGVTRSINILEAAVQKTKRQGAKCNERPMDTCN